MKMRISTSLLPFLLITVLVTAAVQGFYMALERYVFVVPKEVVSSLNTPKDDLVDEGGADEFKEEPENIDYSVIVNRNLFGPPPEKKLEIVAEEQTIEELEISQLDVVLMGTIGGGGDEEARAIILNKKDRKQELYRVGDAIEGALIKRIKRGQVVLNYNGKDEMLDITEAANYRSKVVVPASRSQPPSRRRVSVQPSEDIENQENIDGRPRVVRPTRRIVRPRRVLTPSTPGETETDMDQVIQPEDEVPEMSEVPEE